MGISCFGRRRVRRISMAVRMIWREKNRSRIGAMLMDNLIGFLGIKRMDQIYRLESCAGW